MIVRFSQYSDDEREDGTRVKGVRLFDDSDFERFMTLVDSDASEWTLAGGPAADQTLNPEEVRVERRPCPKGLPKCFILQFFEFLTFCLKKRPVFRRVSSHDCN